MGHFQVRFLYVLDNKSLSPGNLPFFWHRSIPHVIQPRSKVVRPSEALGCWGGWAFTVELVYKSTAETMEFFCHRYSLKMSQKTIVSIYSCYPKILRFPVSFPDQLFEWLDRGWWWSPGTYRKCEDVASSGFIGGTYQGKGEISGGTPSRNLAKKDFYPL